MSSIFGKFSSTPEKKEKLPSYREMIEKYFPEEKLLQAVIEKYLAMRRERNDIPAKISFEEQLKLLTTYPKHDRIEQVEKSILGGYRSLCYPLKKKEVKEIKKEKKERIIMEVAY